MLTAIAIWWMTLSLMGWLLWPLVAWMLPEAPARGWPHARVMGLLLLCYFYWLMGYAGANLVGVGVLVAVGVGLIAASILVAWRRRRQLGETLRHEWRTIVIAELLFAIAFTGYSLYRGCDARIDHTEEPMDFAFLNGILRSVRMPPIDPWMAGKGISYYYFGHLMVAVMAKLTGTASGVAYNLGLGQTFALAVVGGYGVLLGLAPGEWRGQGALRWRRIGWAAAGALLVMLAGNLEGLFELLRARGIGSARLYRALDVVGLEAPSGPASWLPEGHWWWWRASRVIQDDNVLGKMTTVISEFPSFSFVLGDLHAHVLSLPLMMLALAIVTQLVADAGRFMSWRKMFRGRYLQSALCLGALGFANSWDWATMMVLLGLVLVLAAGGDVTGRWRRRAIAIVSCVLISLFGILLYTPFYRDLTSQVRGIGLAYWTKTSSRHLFLVLGGWLLPLTLELSWGRRLAWEALSAGERRGLWGGLAALACMPWIATLALGGWGRALLGLGIWLAKGPWTAALLLALLTLALLALLAEEKRGAVLTIGGSIMAYGMVFIGLGLVYGAEFLYVRDMFDTRMNTVFKLYYQAWILFGLGGWVAIGQAFCRGGWQRAVAGACTALLVASCWYGLAAGWTRALRYPGEWTLDGTAYLDEVSPCEGAAIRWLAAEATPDDVVLEAPGKEFDARTSRLSAWSGVPTVIGWPGHEAQWRGSDDEVAARVADVDALYLSRNAARVSELLAHHGVTYLYVGPSEVERYALRPVNVTWYGTFLEEAFACEQAVLYRVSDVASSP